MNHNPYKLPLEYPFKKVIKIYGFRILVFLIPLILFLFLLIFLNITVINNGGSSNASTNSITFVKVLSIVIFASGSTSIVSSLLSLKSDFDDIKDIIEIDFDDLNETNLKKEN